MFNLCKCTNVFLFEVIQMSIPIYEKIERIRAAEGLTQAEFSEKIGVSANTLNAMKSRGSSPRFDVLEKICQVWPQYGLWLITGESEALAGQFEPERNSNEKIIFQIIESCSARNIDNLIVNPKHITEVIFLQSVGDGHSVNIAGECHPVKTSDQINRKLDFSEKHRKSFIFGIPQNFGTAILMILTARENRGFPRAILIKDDEFDLKEALSDLEKGKTFLAIKSWLEDAGINKFDIGTVHYKTLRILESDSDELKLSDIYPSADDDAIKSLIEWRKSFK